MEISEEEIIEHEREMQRYYDAQWIETMKYHIEHYLTFLSKSKEVVEQTKNSRNGELFYIINLIQNHLSNYEYMLLVGCRALDRLHFMINSDLETSLFLALNGKYYPAVALLRKVLEVSIRCIYLDSLSDKASAKIKIDNWLNGGKFPKRTFYDTLNALISNKIDQHLTSQLKRLELFENSSLKQALTLLYKEFHIFVHLRPPTTWDEDLTLSFSEFKPNAWKNYHDLFLKVTKLIEILLIIKFPKIVSTGGIGKDVNSYTGLQLSKKELEELANFAS